MRRLLSGLSVTEDESHHHRYKKMTQTVSRCLGDDEDAHEEDHHKKDPHEKPVHHLCNLLPLRCLDTRSSLLAEAVGDELDILHHLRERLIGELKPALKEIAEE